MRENEQILVAAEKRSLGGPTEGIRKVDLYIHRIFTFRVDCCLVFISYFIRYDTKMDPFSKTGGHRHMTFLPNGKHNLMGLLHLCCDVLTRVRGSIPARCRGRVGR